MAYRLEEWVSPKGNAFLRGIDDGDRFLSPGKENKVVPELQVEGARCAQIVHRGQKFLFKDFNDAKRHMREIYKELVTFETRTGLHTNARWIVSNQLGSQILEVIYSDGTRNTMI